ncbi:Eukaryotic aspartyl protease family protein [Rhynchospora pubera]|uniref:Eukaryotic aspartyl protease family protein n=1 Tax=Rhynchospora pubera TaxID=906938 RepID=A0AAV8BTA0_9POAL|nr:Eukaryotic aspartyl protease family protein [Rhynchospora pubera]
MATNDTGFSVDLVHRDSIKSPFYNSSYTPDDQIRTAIQRSISRAQYLQDVIASTQIETPSSYDSNIIASQVEYLMTVKVGTPATSILAVADTGSDLFWTNCEPCKDCYKQNTPLFNPNSSTTYRDLSCSDDFCSAAGSNCEKNQCHYNVNYGDGSTSSGTLAKETFTFDTSNGKAVGVDNIVFGCAHQSDGNFEPNMAGIVGLGTGSTSLVSQLGSSVGKRFSYCLVPYSAKNTSSKLNFGSNALFSNPNVQTTNLISGVSDTYYTVNLANIRLGNQDIQLSVNNIIIDSGTTLNLLYYDTVDQIAALLEKEIPLPTVNDSQLQLCYKASDLKKVALPDIVYTLGTATVTLGSTNYFVEFDGKMCLAMIGIGQSSDGSIVQILGNVAQQDFHVGFDLDKGKVYFAPTDCTKQ